MKKIRKILVVYYVKYYKAFTKVEKSLKTLGFSYSKANRENEAAIKKLVGKADAVVVVGGDGTLLRVSHFVEDKPVLHISSSRQAHEAFFSRATGSDALQKLKRLQQGKYKILKLMRLEAWLNGRRLPYKALNEVFAGGRAAYNTVRYELAVGKRKEEQKSSGVIIATPAGSNAWAKSAGAKAVPITSKKIVYVVREPYFGRLTKPRLVKGAVSSNGRITIRSKIWQGGIISIDSYRMEFLFNYEDKLVVKAAGQDLDLVTF